ncbi:MAG: CUB domain-containing protein, partial [Bacteroidota bacterium]|nr:CUB domain-containing protein [Bacteroidota bacterium]
STETNTCSGTSDDDVWYSFTATNDTLDISLLNISGTTTDMYLAVYEGNNCNSLTDVLCSDSEAAQLTGLTVGNDYMIRIYSYSSGDYNASFDLCIGEPEPPGPGDECGQSIAFCTGENYLFPASVNEPDLGGMGCLYTTPNPAWYYMEIDDPGDVVIDIASDYDVDFIAWGPFTDVSNACTNADTTYHSEYPNNTTDPSYYPVADVIDCSYSTASAETVTIPGAQSGEVYLLLITNYANQPTNIQFEQTGGAGSANCVIVAPPIDNNGPLCEGDNLELYVTYPEPGATYSWSGPNGFTSSDMEPIITNVTIANAGTYSLVITVDGITSDTVTTDVVINPWTTPTFNAVGPYCDGDAIPALPTTSTNGITGSWSPAIDNTTTTTYTFTPDADQCAYTTTLDIVISSSITPTFDPIGPICETSGAPTSPTYNMADGANITTTSGVFYDPQGTAGYNDFNGSYTMTFCSGTPEALQFVFTEFDTDEANDNLTIYDGPNTGSLLIGTYSQTTSPGTITSSGTCLTFVWSTDNNQDGNPGWVAEIYSIPIFPTTSNNGVTGTWSPSFDPTTTTTYTFTPDGGSCATSTTMTVTITPEVTPTFTQLGPYCVGDASDALPGTSTNGISGTWSPATISTASDGT